MAEQSVGRLTPDEEDFRSFDPRIRNRYGFDASIIHTGFLFLHFVQNPPHHSNSSCRQICHPLLNPNLQRQPAMHSQKYALPIQTQRLRKSPNKKGLFSQPFLLTIRPDLCYKIILGLSFCHLEWNRQLTKQVVLCHMQIPLVAGGCFLTIFYTSLISLIGGFD